MSGGPLEPGQSVERYDVEAVLGEGGMAVVYRVRHRTLGTAHALKVLSSVGYAARDRLLLEGRAQAGLRHPNIVAVTDVLDVDGAPGLLMDYVPTPSLAAWLEQGTPPLDEALSLFRGIVAGVHHAHLAGFVHRDLKPGNVLLAQGVDGAWVPRVADFGIAKHLTEPTGTHRTGTGVGMGTPRYMAPEQFRDARAVDARADIYSLGCILVELLTGAPAVEGSDPLRIYAAASAGHHRALPPELPGALRAAVEGCLAPDPDDRIQDCVALMSVLDGRSWTPLATGSSSPRATILPGAETLATVGGLPSTPEAGVGRGKTTLAPWGIAAGLAGLLGVLGVGVVALLLAFWGGGLEGLRSGGDEAPAAEAPAAAAHSAETLSAEAATVTTPTLEESASASVSTPPPGTLPAQAPAASTAAPRPATTTAAPSAAASARVSLSGDATRVEANSEAGRFPLPGVLPAGTYVLTAWFVANPAAQVGRLTVGAGDVVDLRCQSSFSRCSPVR